MSDPNEFITHHAITLSLGELNRIASVAAECGMEPQALLESWILAGLAGAEMQSGTPPVTPASVPPLTVVATTDHEGC